MTDKKLTLEDVSLDIPDADTFIRELETLRRMGEANRRAQAQDLAHG